MFYFQICKRLQYLDAWKRMYSLNKEIYNDPIYDGINPASNRPLETEVDNICVVCKNDDMEPIGIFSVVLTMSRAFRYKIIGKQWVVDSRFQGKGIGSAMCMILENEIKIHWMKGRGLKDRISHYYIGCSSMSKRIQERHGNSFYNGMEDAQKHDLYKFNVDLYRENWEEQYFDEVLKRIESGDFKIDHDLAD